MDNLWISKKKKFKTYENKKSYKKSKPVDNLKELEQEFYKEFKTYIDLEYT